MSPEQARGKPVDKQTDIWAFGCVLFEMLAGSAAFSGNDVTDILAAVIRSEPDWEKAPMRVRPLLRRCLQKDPNKRLRDIGDVKLDLEEVLSNPNEVSALPVAPAEPRTKLRVMVPWLVAAVVLTAIIVGAAVWRLKPREPRPIARFSCILPEDLTLISGIQAIAISPDGGRFVCATNKGLYLRSMDQLQGNVIPGTEGGVGTPIFSPDGKHLLTTGQSPINISLLGIGASEEPKQLRTSKFNEFNASISPDGRWIAYQSDESGRFEIYVRPFPEVNTQRHQISTEGGQRPLWNENGRELFYYLPPGIVISVPVETGSSFKAGTPKVLFRGLCQRTWPVPESRQNISPFVVA